jgi:hypothetical protein
MSVPSPTLWGIEEGEKTVVDSSSPQLVKLHDRSQPGI